MLLLTDSQSIREVILFPHMRPETIQIRPPVVPIVRDIPLSVTNLLRGATDASPLYSDLFLPCG